LHRVRLIVPSLRDDGGTPILTPWMPLLTLHVGNGFGVQWAPYGGATFENPTAGEQMLIHVIERTQGISLAAAPAYNQQMQPPFAQMNAGDFAVKAPSGDYVYLPANGQVQVNSQTMVSAGNLTEEVVKVVRQEFQVLFNTHTHPGTGPPEQQMTNVHLTTIFKAN
jgi:hypothetical protein